MAKTKSARFLKSEARNYQPSEWVAFYYKGESPRRPRLFDGNLPREKARWAYSRETGVSYKAARVRKVSSFGKIYS